ncbi:glycosyltransferase family 4 protein [Methanotrichaceae archaeon M04Ac]|uniref:Glycosyltransferase family 4 protein n=1 Tax=Candidatus Methanocrinis alkalitolerans TaxID=3033395 RepID=A0ABT5XGA9_9EURY|nr:glycosyltransferase family 4 protein [Candidatus Methanocrinis alkalitolerans]MDF0593750.1 glycosyltransferase family 4 protein [Candidatus Methanocrinis alkalitolerans]
MKKRIIICCNAYPPNFIGGAEIIAHEHAKIFKRLGHEIVVFAGDVHIGGERYSIYRDVYEGINVYRVSLTHQDYNPEFVNFANRDIEDKFIRILDEFLPDVAHFHNLFGLPLTFIQIAKSRGIKTILTVHDYWVFCLKGTTLNRVDEVCDDWTQCSGCMPFIKDDYCRVFPLKMRRDFFDLQFHEVDAFISPSKYLADACIRAGMPKEKFNVISNGIDIKRFSNISKKPMEDRVRFTFIGYFGKHKGIQTLIKAVSLLENKDKICINLVGSGELLNISTQQVSDMRLNGSIKFWGRIPNIEDAYRETDVFVLPSIWPENQPVTIMEAMASRTPVIASDIGGSRELVDDGKTGYLFQAGDPVDLADKMNRFINNPLNIHKFGENGYNKIKDDTLDASVDKILRIYDRNAPGGESSPQGEFLIACIGDRIDPECLLAMAVSSISKGFCQPRSLFVKSNWLQEDQFDLVKLIWIVDKEAKQNDDLAVFKDDIPLLVPEANEGLKRLCIDGKHGLYYKNATEADACIQFFKSRLADVYQGT